MELGGNEDDHHSLSAADGIGGDRGVDDVDAQIPESPIECHLFSQQYRDEECILRDWKAFIAMKEQSRSSDYVLRIRTVNVNDDSQWKRPRDAIRKVTRCGPQEAMEMVWKLRMYGTVIVAVGDKQHIEGMQQV